MNSIYSLHSSVQNSKHFFTNDQILQIDSQTPFQEVYKRLHQQNCGAFFLTVDGEARCFVRAYLLAKAVIGNAIEFVNEIPGLSQDSRNEELKNQMKMISEKPIGYVVRDASKWTPVVPIYQVPSSSDTDTLGDYEDRAFDLRDGDERIGWYLNHESVADATTEKTIYRCTNPRDPHNNTDPDHGACYKCIYPIGGAEKKFGGSF